MPLTQPDLSWPLCQFFMTPTDAERAELKVSDPDVVFRCSDRQGAGPLYFFVPVEGGAVRVGVCPRHAEQLKRQFGEA